MLGFLRQPKLPSADNSALRFHSKLSAISDRYSHAVVVTKAPVSWLLALILMAFAANSVLCRMALGGATADPISFTAIRLVSGALMLVLLSAWRHGLGRPLLNLPAAICLFVYAICAPVVLGGVMLVAVARGRREGTGAGAGRTSQ